MRGTLPRRAFLGAELASDAETFSDAGMRVVGVTPGGMAECAGVAAGDTITAVGGQPVRTLGELRAALRVAGAHATTAIAYADRSHAVAIAPHPREPGAIYDVLEVAGARLRTIELRSPTPRALVLVAQGIACETVDLGAQADLPLHGLVHDWVHAGVDSLRVDKRGVGDSEGDVATTVDFATELADVRAALVHATALARARGVPLVIFGHSVGGIIASVLAGDHPVDGVITYGAPVMAWLDCIVDTTRRQLAMLGRPEDEIVAATTGLAERARSSGLNGRTAAYHAQLAAVDPAAAWRRVTAPILVVRGEHDWVVRADDQARIATLASATIADVPGLDHLLGWQPDHATSMTEYGNGAFDPAISRVTLAWLASVAPAG